MEFLTLPLLAVMIPAVVFAGISKGGFGSGAAFASSSILALVLEPGQALAIMLPLLMLIDVSSLPTYWKKWDWGAAKVLMIGAVPGTVLGALFYAWADPDMVRLLIGLVCIAFVAWQMAAKSGLIGFAKTQFGPRAGLVAGTGLGFTSFISHAGGPVAAVYLLGQGFSKTTYQATTVLVFWVVNVLKAGVYGGMGIFTTSSLTVALVMAPFALLGTWLGIKAHHILSERVFFALTYVLLTITGAKLIWDALT